MDTIKMTGVVKCSRPICANDGIDLVVGQQEIRCLLGENGTGGSTLMSTLFGLYHPDAGEVFINEREAAITNLNDVYALGIGTVHQHFTLVNQLTVLENVIMGKEPGGLFLNRKESWKKMEELMGRFGFRIDLQEKMVNLSVGMEQRVGILKTLYRGADIIILGEPTAVLTPQEVDELFKILRQLKENDKTIIFITHELNEAMSLSSRIMVIRKGKMVSRCSTSSINEKELATQMVDRQVGNIVAERGQKAGQAVLELKGVRLHEGTGETVSLKVHAEEIPSIAGVNGNRQRELEEVTAGNCRVREGEIFINGIPVQNMTVKDRKATGLGYIPSDRHKNAMIPSFSITENLLLDYQETPEYCRKGFIDCGRLRRDAEKQVEELGIEMAGMDQEVGQLSGGNQQKVIPGREISHDPGLMMVAQPARGLNIGVVERVHKTPLQLKEQGRAVLLMSTELSEIMSLNDRIAVFYKGEVSTRPNNRGYVKEEIRLFMAGRKQEVRVHEMEQQ